MSAQATPVPFHRIEHTSPAPNRPILVETRCAFCQFLAASSDERIVEIAELTHDCPGIREFREQESTGQKTA